MRVKQSRSAVSKLDLLLKKSFAKIFYMPYAIIERKGHQNWGVSLFFFQLTIAEGAIGYSNNKKDLILDQVLLLVSNR